MGGHRRPNILWYCTDQQRYDTIGYLGNKEVHTPYLDEFCQNNVVFDRAYTQSPVCTPSRASFLTGRYPSSHHVQRNGNEFFPPQETLVTKLFAESGYDCGLVGKLHLSGSQHEIEQRADDGYRFYCWSHHPFPDIAGNAYTKWLAEEKGVDAVELYDGIKHSYGAGVPEELHHTKWCTDMALRFVDQKRDGPWLLSINIFSPHPPFLPPQNYLDRFDPEKLSMPIFRESDLIRQEQFLSVDQQTVNAIDPNDLLSAAREKPGDVIQDLPADMRASFPPSIYDPRMVKACYYAEIEFIDAQFGRLLDALEKRGELENTIVVFMSDHGELLGDHGLLYKGCRFFDSLVHVPLAFGWKDHWKGQGRRADLVELVDLAPTLLDAAGLQVPYYMQGKSLGRILEGDSDTGQHRTHVVSEYFDAMGPKTTATQYSGSHGIMYFDGKYKLNVYHDTEIVELFDLETDPGEFTNLWDNPEYQDVKLELLKAHLDAYMSTTDPGPRRTKEY